MEQTQTSIAQDDGILIISCVGTLDEKTAPPIFGSMLKYAKESSQIAIFDLTKTEGIKTAFITGVIEITKYIQASGGWVLVVPGKMGDILEITGIQALTKVIPTLEEAKSYAKEHFPQIIDFIREQKNKQEISAAQKVSESVNLENWKFFSDEEKKTIDLESILDYSMISRASDIHLSVENPITFRIQGVLVKMDKEPLLSADHLNQIKETMLGEHPEIIKKLDEIHDVDFGYVSKKDKVSFRVNGFWTLQKLSFTLRRIEQHAKTIEDLWLPRAIDAFLSAKQGLVLVTGPTGSGKSTTLVAMLEEINRTRWENIITIEDPIEFLFEDKKSIFSQREIGRDTNSFVGAIRAAMREDPDIVMVGEMRDTETVEAALNLAETGHLVFSTLHTSGSVQTISRIVQFFNPDQQRQIFTRLADSILWVLSQRLVHRRDGKNERIALFELMIVNSGIKNLIRSGDLAQLNNAIQMGRSEGMIPMYTYAQELEQKWIIHHDDYAWFFTNQDI